MVMEAMRLSLIEHEEQQKKEREAEAKKQQGATSDSPEQSEGAGPSIASPGCPGSGAAEATERNEGVLNGLSPVSGGSMPGSSVSLSHQLSAEQPNGSHSGRRGSPSPTPSQYSIRAALASATSTASAVLSPGGGDGNANGSNNGDLVSHEDDNDGHLPPLSPPPHVIVTPELGNTAPVPPSDTPRLRYDSESSSVTPDNNTTYQTLHSSPGSGASSISQKPLLDSPLTTSLVSPGPANGNPSSTQSS